MRIAIQGIRSNRLRAALTMLGILIGVAAVILVVAVESRFPVGSSARIRAGSVTRARAMATRCCWPPDSSPGRCRTRSASPTRASASVARARRWSRRTPV